MNDGKLYFSICCVIGYVHIMGGMYSKAEDSHKILDTHNLEQSPIEVDGFPFSKYFGFGAIQIEDQFLICFGESQYQNGGDTNILIYSLNASYDKKWKIARSPILDIRFFGYVHLCDGICMLMGGTRNRMSTSDAILIADFKWIAENEESDASKITDNYKAIEQLNTV